MNSNTLNKILPFLIIIFFASKNVAQNPEEYSNTKEKYRITAYKKENNQIVSQSNSVELTTPLKLYIPNAFTPNSDGLNDVFGAAGKGIVEYNLQVFDRWGELVFETNDLEKGWDGKYKGEMSEAGTYVYQVLAKGEQTGRVKRNGTITLIQ